MNIIFNFLSGLLNSIFSFTGDWGLAIVILTLGVRLVLSPMSFKQKKSMQQQQKFAIKMQEIKEKYKDNTEKLDLETKKQSAESAKGMLGCLVIPVSVGTYLIPWVSSIKVSDSYFIVPVIYVIASLAPSLISYVPILKIEGQATISKSNIIIMAVFGLFVAKAAPIAVGIYLITTSVFNFLEELVFRIYMRNLKTMDL